MQKNPQKLSNKIIIIATVVALLSLGGIFALMRSGDGLTDAERAENEKTIATATAIATGYNTYIQKNGQLPSEVSECYGAIGKKCGVTPSEACGSRPAIDVTNTPSKALQELGVAIPLPSEQSITCGEGGEAHGVIATSMKLGLRGDFGVSVMQITYYLNKADKCGTILGHDILGDRSVDALSCSIRVTKDGVQ